MLTAASQLPPTLGARLQPYTVRVFTSRLRGAGTDANVCINAIGVSGSSGWKELPAREGTFEQGQVRLQQSRMGGVHACGCTPFAPDCQHYRLWPLH